MEGWDRGFELIPAGHLATKHINRDPDTLPGYKLEVINVPSEACAQGVAEYYRHLIIEKDMFSLPNSESTNFIKFVAVV